MSVGRNVMLYLMVRATEPWVLSGVRMQAMTALGA